MVLITSFEALIQDVLHFVNYGAGRGCVSHIQSASSSAVWSFLAPRNQDGDSHEAKLEASEW